MLQQAQAVEGGAAAAAAGKACTYAFRSTPQALLCIAQREGWRVLFAGLSINYMKVGCCLSPIRLPSVAFCGGAWLVGWPWSQRQQSFFFYNLSHGDLQMRRCG